MPTVLAVEDERDIRELLRRHLERAGLSVLATASGCEALRSLSATDLVILDPGLPGLPDSAWTGATIKGCSPVPFPW
jgi:CheY-like chemotaxis protein